MGGSRSVRFEQPRFPFAAVVPPLVHELLVVTHEPPAAAQRALVRLLGQVLAPHVRVQVVIVHVSRAARRAAVRLVVRHVTQGVTVPLLGRGVKLSANVTTEPRPHGAVVPVGVLLLVAEGLEGPVARLAPVRVLGLVVGGPAAAAAASFHCKKRTKINQQTRKERVVNYDDSSRFRREYSRFSVPVGIFFKTPLSRFVKSGNGLFFRDRPAKGPGGLDASVFKTTVERQVEKRRVVRIDGDHGDETFFLLEISHGTFLVLAKNLVQA